MNRLAQAISEIADISAEAVSEVDFLRAALRVVLDAAEGSYAALLARQAARDQVLASAGEGGSQVPRELVSEALDREGTVQSDGWLALPLRPRGAEGEVLAVAGCKCTEVVPPLAGLLATQLDHLRSVHAHALRIERLQTILEITEQWNATNETEPLLVQMAEAATRLFDADRASIFLWDRDREVLVGRPALGVENGDLVVPDDKGVVGEVIRTLEPVSVDGQTGGDQIDRDVDRKLGYQTRSLLCVPLVAGTGGVLGAFQVLNKHHGNFTADDKSGLCELARHAAVALESTQQFEALFERHKSMVEEVASRVQLIGQSAAIDALRSTIHRVADTELAILVLGENGTGKEVVSQMIHYLSRRRDEPFIAVNCAAIAETLLESELFGHEKGAFTDAHESRAGKFEQAAGGTLFLDEIGDLSLGGQAKLLRVLEEKIVVRVGGSTPIPTRARVIAATNHNLAEMVREKRFREDLYYRLNVVSIELPPLRERGDDILLLAKHFLSQFARAAGRKVPRLTADARKRLRAHSWPGNVRELRNLMERIAYLAPEDKIRAEDLAFILSPGASEGDLMDSGLTLADATRRFQSDYIKHAIERTGSNMSEAAERLGLHRSNLYRKMRQLEMAVEEGE